MLYYYIILYSRKAVIITFYYYHNIGKIIDIFLLIVTILLEDYDSFEVYNNHLCP